jgi:steroid delta-isomerase-like uncharacterized protein
MLEENKALIRKAWDEIFNKRNLEAVDEYFAEDATIGFAPPGLPPDREFFKQTVAPYLTAFPDLKVVLEDQIAEDGTVASRFSVTGTHKGELAGIAASGNEVDYTGVNYIKVRDGKIVEVWGASDQLRVMRQIGAIPS